MSVWLRFAPPPPAPGMETAPAPAEVLELTEEQACDLWHAGFETITAHGPQVVYFTVRGEVLAHYVRAVPASSSGRAERDKILAKHRVLVPVCAGVEVHVTSTASRYCGRCALVVAADPEGGWRVDADGVCLHFEASEVAASWLEGASA